MRSDPEGRELCRLSAGYGHKDACGRMGAVLNDPLLPLNDEFCCDARCGGFGIPGIHAVALTAQTACGHGVGFY